MSRLCQCRSSLPRLLAKVPVHFCFDRQTSGAIPSDVLVYACLEYIQSLVHGTSHQSGSMALSRLLYGESSPGLIFKVPESGLHRAVDQVFPHVSGLHLSGWSRDACAVSLESIARGV